MWRFSLRRLPSSFRKRSIERKESDEIYEKDETTSVRWNDCGKR